MRSNNSRTATTARDVYKRQLIGTNANIMKGVIENVVKYSPRAIIIVVANPMDTLTYLALKASGCLLYTSCKNNRKSCTANSKR